MTLDTPHLDTPQQTRGDGSALRHPGGASGRPASERLEARTIRELIIDLGKAEEAIRGDRIGQLDKRKATLWEQAIIKELHRRRDAP